MPAIVLRMMDDCKFFFVKNTLIDAYWILLGSYLSIYRHWSVKNRKVIFQPDKFKTDVFFLSCYFSSIFF